MTALVDLERALDDDPLAMRLSQAKVPPVSPDLVRAVQTGGHPRRMWRRRRAGAAVAGAVAAALSLLVVTPSGALIGRAVLPAGLQQRLGLVEGAPTLLTPPSQGPGGGLTISMSPVPCSQDRPVAVHPTGGAAGGVVCYPDLSLSDAQRQVAFTIPTPSALPAGLGYRGAMVDSPHSVYISYGRTGGQSGGLGINIRTDTPVGGSAVPSGSVQRVEVDGSLGYYVRGSYEDNGPGTAARWNPNADAGELTWQHAGMTFDMTEGGLGLSAADLVRIAESVR